MNRTEKPLCLVSNRVAIKTVACFLLTAGTAIPTFAAMEHTDITSLDIVQQNGVTAKGTVTDANGEPIIGATVMETGTRNGTVTDIDGRFSLTTNRNAMLEVSYVGFKTKTIKAGENVKITLEEDLRDLNEVVVIGYGTQKKADVTSSVASVKAEDFNKGSVLDAGQLVQGKVAGLQISLASGDPTASTSVMLRGTSSLLGSSTPLILVDGVPGSFSTVAPEEIQTIDVLKDGSATAIYGTRGTNGVIIITTKSGNREMPTTIEYNGYLSVSSIARKADFLSASDLRARWADGYSASGANDQDYGATTDWLKAVTRTALSNNHNLTFRGGNKKTSYVATLNYSDRQGTMKKTDITNIRARAEVTHRMFDDKLTTTLAIIANESQYPYGYSPGTTYRDACIQNPTQPIYNDDGSYVERQVYFYDNPVSLQQENIGSSRNRNVRFTGTMIYRQIGRAHV